MRYRIKTIVLVFFSLLFFLIVAGIVVKAVRLNNKAEISATMPYFSLPDTSGALFDSRSITSGPGLILYFNTECDHCYYEVSALYSNSNRLQDYFVILITDAGQTAVKDFFTDFNGYSQSGFKILMDTAYYFRKNLEIENVPVVYIYNREFALLKKYYGEVRIESVLRYLAEGD